MTSDWSKIEIGDTVALRGKRFAFNKVVTVVELLAPVRPDGRGIVGDDGETYRYYYYDIGPAPTVNDVQLPPPPPPPALPQRGI